MSHCKACDRLLEEFTMDELYELCNNCYCKVLDDLTDKDFRRNIEDES